MNSYMCIQRNYSLSLEVMCSFCRSLKTTLKNIQLEDSIRLFDDENPIQPTSHATNLVNKQIYTQILTRFKSDRVHLAHVYVHTNINIS